MITEKDLAEAIAECQGERNPNANTCIKLAAYYTIKNYMYGESERSAVPSYSFAPSPTVEIDSGTEFAQTVKGRRVEEILPVMDELMTALSVLNPRLYNATLAKLEEL